jgi:predicted RNA binding protein YcfA (HicA-like mRNA interferase family)
MNDNLLMGKQEKVIDTILRGTSDANISFDDIRSLLLHLGFDERIRGSHHVYRKQGIDEKINIQSAGGKIKPYQAKQIREIILKYHVAGR